MCRICYKDFDINTTKLECSYCPRLTTIPFLPKLTELDCSNCLRLTSIPSLLNLTRLFCSYCPITSIPSLPNLIALDCTECQLTSISLPKLIELNYSGCRWLNIESEITNRLIVIQRRFRQLIKYYRFVRFIKSREFNEWFYAPEGIGGKNHKIRLEKFVSNLNKE